MAEIALHDGSTCIVDDADFDWLNQWKWRRNGGQGRSNYAVRTEGRRNVWMHRVIMDAPEGLEVDHINRDGCDNRRANLRLATRQQNGCNRANNRKGMRGASFHRGYWRAVIVVDGRQVALGQHPNGIAAAAAYDAAAKVLFGEFASLNFGPDRDWLIVFPKSVEEATRRAKALRKTPPLDPRGPELSAFLKGEG